VEELIQSSTKHRLKASLIIEVPEAKRRLLRKAVVNKGSATGIHADSATTAPRQFTALLPEQSGKLL